MKKMQDVQFFNFQLLQIVGASLQANKNENKLVSRI